MPKPQSTQKELDLDSPTKITRSMANPTPEDIALVKRAFTFARRVHEGHRRYSGEPYLRHLSETAQTLAELGAGATTIVAGLLHDAIEDVGVKRETIVSEFGEEVAFLVDGVTKLGHLNIKVLTDTMRAYANFS